MSGISVLTAAGIANALGYTPASAGAVLMQSGSAAAPGMPFAADLNTGFYQAVDGDDILRVSAGGVLSGSFTATGYLAPNGSLAAPSAIIGTNGVGFFRSAALSADYSPGLGFADVTSGKQIMTLHYGVDTSGGSNADAAVLRLGTGQAIVKQTADVYIGTIRAPSVDTTGAGSRFCMLNIGSMSATATDTATRTLQQVTVELDKTDLYAGGGAVTYNDTVGLRVNAFTPRDTVTIAHNKGIVISPPVRYDTGSSTLFTGIYFNAMNITGIGNTTGLLFADNPSKGSIASISGIDLSFIASATGTAGGSITLVNTGNVTINGANSGGQVNLQSNGTTGLRIGTTSGEFWSMSSSGEMKLIANASGGGGNCNGVLSSGGTGNISLFSDAGAVEILRAVRRASGVNYLNVQPGASGGNVRLYPSAENLQLGAGSAIATTATAGYIMIQATTGTPTGVPVGAAAGAIPMIYDTGANKIWFYNSGWRGVLVS